MLAELGKVAVVITGELRTWEVAKRYIFEFFDRFPNAVDYYFVTWNESSDYWFNPAKKITAVDEGVIKESFNGRNLIHLHIEDVLSNRHDTSIFLLKSHLSKIANVLKRRYEFDNNFIYDNVIEIRPDVFITPADGNLHMCNSFDIVIDNMFYDFYLKNNVPLLPDLYFRTSSLGHDIISNRNTYGKFKELNKFVDLERKGFEFDPMLTTRDVHFMLFDFLAQRRMSLVYEVRNEVGDIMAIRPNVPNREEPYTIDEIRHSFNEYLRSMQSQT